MALSRTTALLLVGLCLLTLIGDASAFGRRGRAASCPAPCPKPCPSHPAFSLHAWLYEGDGYVQWSPDRPIRLPVEIGVTNLECYPWTYTNAEYGFHLFDECGCCLTNAFIQTAELRTITVIPRASVLDQPNLFVKPGVLQLGKRYTLVVTLRGRSACLQFTPVVSGDPKSGS